MCVCRQGSQVSFLLIFTPAFVFIFRQCSSQSDPTSANQQVQLLLGEKQQLEAYNQQVFVQGPFSLKLSSCLSLVPYEHVCVCLRTVFRYEL